MWYNVFKSYWLTIKWLIRFSIVLSSIICVSNLYDENSLSNGPKGWIWTRFSFSNLVTNVWGHVWNSNYQSGNPLESVDIHFLALSHTCGDVLKSWDIFSTHFPLHALTLGLPWWGDKARVVTKLMHGWVPS